MKKLLEKLMGDKKIILIFALLIAVIIAVLILSGKDGGSAAQSSTADKSGTEIKLTRILENISGVGNADVMINEDDKGIYGVVIVCEGADNIMTRNDIINAVSTALNVEKNIIAVYAMN